MNKYVGKTVKELLPLLEVRACKCGCGLKFKTLPTSTQWYARAMCEGNRTWKSKTTFCWNDPKNKVFPVKKNVFQLTKGKRQEKLPHKK